MRFKLSDTVFIAVLLAVTVSAYIFNSQYLSVNREASPHTGSDESQVTSAANPTAASETTKEEAALPESFLLDVPFLVQAPFANWDPLHEEACEEASLIMVKYFYDKNRFSSLEAADAEIRKLISWQTDKGYGVDVTVSELATIAKNYYGMSSGRVVTNPTVQEIKEIVAAGHPVIVPAAGRELPNPYFTPPGPKYHMLVIKGYTTSEFITNDPGTRRGEGFTYSHQALLNALHDWNTADVSQGRKAMLTFQ